MDSLFLSLVISSFRNKEIKNTMISIKLIAIISCLCLGLVAAKMSETEIDNFHQQGFEKACAASKTATDEEIDKISKCLIDIVSFSA